MHLPISSAVRQNLDCNQMAKIPTTSSSDYTLAIKNKGRPPKPWRWEIYEAGKSKPVQQSEFFETMSQATRAGKAALMELRSRAA